MDKPIFKRIFRCNCFDLFLKEGNLKGDKVVEVVAVDFADEEKDEAPTGCRKNKAKETAKKRKHLTRDLTMESPLLRK